MSSKIHRVLCFFLSITIVFIGSTVVAQSADDLILSTLRYGIDEKVNETLNKLISDKNYKYDEEIYKILLETKNQKIKETIIKYFASKDPPDERIILIAEQILSNRDSETKEVVLAVFTYFTKLKKFNKPELLETILSNSEKDYIVPALKLIGSAKLQNFAKTLLNLYEKDETTQEVKQEILLALGELQVAEALDLYKKIINRGEDSGKVERMYVC
ncbi:MAG TPA: hypothetical protein PLV76_05640, partial [Spirochaetales bacterium]|nr:hypothetical protein [Spirochaetales bacterium]